MRVAKDAGGADAAVDIQPLWARLSLAYERRTPNHPGKRTVRRALHAVGARRTRPFAWPMRNGSVVAISPVEGALFAGTVGWSCFEHGVWEPHVERCLRELLQPGDVAYDVGANLGYFSAVMAQAVGPGGRVHAFEPIPETFNRLQLCRSLNGFEQLNPLQLALGAEDGELQLHWDPRTAGQASAHTGSGESVSVPVRRLDALVSTGQLDPPRVLKIDVEGHELAVFRGALETLSHVRPAIVFEVNGHAADRAGWAPADVADVLRKCAPYRFFMLSDRGREPVELEALELGAHGYRDVLALA
jgi:FkbM family methyltransferase